MKFLHSGEWFNHHSAFEFIIINACDNYVTLIVVFERAKGQKSLIVPFKSVPFLTIIAGCVGASGSTEHLIKKHHGATGAGSVSRDDEKTRQCKGSFSFFNCLLALPIYSFCVILYSYVAYLQSSKQTGANDAGKLYKKWFHFIITFLLLSCYCVLTTHVLNSIRERVHTWVKVVWWNCKAKFSLFC